MENDKYITLFSNTNNFSKFRNKFIAPLNLEGDWKVSLLDISFPFYPINVAEQKITFLLCKSQLSDTLHSNDSTGIGVDEEHFFDPGSNPMEIASNSEKDINITNIYKSGTLAAGYYTSVSELTEEISNLFSSLFSDMIEAHEIEGVLCIEYDQNTNHANAYIKLTQDREESVDEEDSNDKKTPHIKIICKNANLLENILGFDNVNEINGKYVTKYCLEITTDDQVSTRPCNLNMFHKIYICSDLIEHQYVGEKSVRLLASCPLPGKGNFHMISATPVVVEMGFR